MRFHLHYVAGRAEERLTFDLQPVVGARMGYTRHGRQDGVERFMRHYFLTAREVTRLTARAGAGAGPRRPRPAGAGSRRPTRRCSTQGFVLADGKLLPRRAAISQREPIQMLRILQVARDRAPGTASAGDARADPPRARRRSTLRGDPEGGRACSWTCCATGRSGPSGAQVAARS